MAKILKCCVKSFSTSVVPAAGSLHVDPRPDRLDFHKPVFRRWFQGVLCLFLLDMGLIAAADVTAKSDLAAGGR
jgi:hypothetical protein